MTISFLPARTPAFRRRWFVGLVFLVSACVAVAADGPDRSTAGIRIRPCTVQESAVGNSPSVVRLIHELTSDDNSPTFSWCEAAEVSWLPAGRILRFHTPIDVDYAETYTVVQAAADCPIHVIRSGEGMFFQPPPTSSADLGVLNELLASAQPEVRDPELASAAILYLFLVGRENRRGIYPKPQGPYALGGTEYHAKVLHAGGQTIARLTARGEEWKFMFSRTGKQFHLNFVSENAD
jgi:hypothetical protein